MTVLLFIVVPGEVGVESAWPQDIKLGHEVGQMAMKQRGDSLYE